jgi:hypothetical protein
MASTTHYLEDLWPVDEEAEALWRARRGRRIAVRCAGWMCFAGMITVAARIAHSPAVRSEILAWGTMGTITTPTAGPLVPPPSALPAAEVTPREPLGDSDAGPAISFVAPAAQDAGAGASERVTARAQGRAKRAPHVARAARAPVIAAAPEDLVIEDPYDDETPRDKKDDPFVDPYRSP